MPCARHQLVAHPDEAWHFAATVGYPLVLKPPSGAGSQATYQIDGPEALQAALASSDPTSGHEALLEEFITGEEHSFDTFSLGGRHLWHSLTHYLPTPLDAMRNPWTEQALLLLIVAWPTSDRSRSRLDALGMEKGLSPGVVRRRGGNIRDLEVATRPPGAQITTLMSRAHDFDAIVAWTRLLVAETFDPPQRRYAAGAAFLRGQGQGVVRAVLAGWSRPRARSFTSSPALVCRHRARCPRRATKARATSSCISSRRRWSAMPSPESSA